VWKPERRGFNSWYVMGNIAPGAAAPDLVGIRFR
jgi:hypothetical protein